MRRGTRDLASPRGASSDPTVARPGLTARRKEWTSRDRGGRAKRRSARCSADEGRLPAGAPPRWQSGRGVAQRSEARVHERFRPTAMPTASCVAPGVMPGEHGYERRLVAARSASPLLESGSCRICYPEQARSGEAGWRHARYAGRTDLLIFDAPMRGSRGSKGREATRRRTRPDRAAVIPSSSSPHHPRGPAIARPQRSGRCSRR